MLRGIRNIGVFASAGGGIDLHPKLTTVLTAAAFYNYTVPSDATLLALSNALFAIGDPILNKLDYFRMYSTDAGLAGFCSLNIIDPYAHNTILVGGVTHNALGVVGNGSSAYLDANWSPIQGVNFQQDSATVLAYSHTNMSSSSTATLLGVDSAVGGSFVMMRPNAGGRNYFDLNNGDVFTPNTYAGNGQIAMTRSSNVDVQFNVNGVELDTNFVASRALGDRNLFLMARNFSSGAIWHAAYHLGYDAVGGFLTSAELGIMHTACSAYLNR